MGVNDISNTNKGSVLRFIKFDNIKKYMKYEINIAKPPAVGVGSVWELLGDGVSKNKYFSENFSIKYELINDSAAVRKNINNSI